MFLYKEADHTSPLCCLQNGSFIWYHRGKVIVVRDGILKKSLAVTVSFLERLLSWSQVISRLMRFGVRAAYGINNNNIVLSISNILYELNLDTGELSEGYFFEDGIRPLSFSSVNSIQGFDDGLYFGGYLSNNDKRPVSIYHRTGINKWDVVYTFPEGTINHVHNIVADPYRNCLWIYTGDFDEAAAIWKVSDGFHKIERVLFNNQKYRACVAFALSEGLLYATDSPYSDNYIYLLDPDTLTLKEIYPIHGSCIYGCQWKDSFVFSSTVEGDGRNLNKWEFLFSKKRGDGIKDNYVHMYMGNLKNGFNEIYKEKKDFWPLYTFQFGVFKFPYGVNNTDTLFFQPVATVENDGKLMGFSYPSNY